MLNNYYCSVALVLKCYIQSHNISCNVPSRNILYKQAFSVGRTMVFRVKILSLVLIMTFARPRALTIKRNDSALLRLRAQFLEDIGAVEVHFNYRLHEWQCRLIFLSWIEWLSMCETIMFHKCHSRAPVYLVLQIFSINMLVLQSKLWISSNAVL